LIDDALSAVDAHVAEHLFEQALVGELMKPKSSPAGEPTKRGVILVTNALQFLKHPMVTRIVVLQHGSVAESGSYSDLSSKKNSVFSRYLAAISESGVSKDALGELSCDANLEQEQELAAQRRRSSIKKDVVEERAGKLMTEETRKTGHVNLGVYLSWSKAAGGTILVPFVIIGLYAAGQVFSVLTKWFLTYWSSHGDEASQAYFLGIYAAINIGTSVFGLVQMLAVALLGLKASRRVSLNGHIFCFPNVFECCSSRSSLS